MPVRGEDIRIIEDGESGLRAAIVIHSSLHGVAAGGIRVRAYADDASMVDEATRLAAAMTEKANLLGVPCGGAKVVVNAARLVDRRRAMATLGRHIEEMRGAIYVGSDFGFTDADGDAMLAETDYVDSAVLASCLGEATAIGVHQALTIALDVAGYAIDTTPGGVDIAIQGLGRVGAPLAGLLLADGARVWGVDLDPGRVEQAGCAPVEASRVLDGDWHALSPCALGGVITLERVERLRCRVLVGAANHILGHPEAQVAEALHRVGVLYVPDFLANAGAFIYWAAKRLEGCSDAEARAAIGRIGRTTRSVLRAAAAEGISPWQVAKSRSR